MEKNLTHQQEFFNWLPIGYMVEYAGQNVPSNFIEVDGQKLSKNKYNDVFIILKGNVVDDGEFFILPKRKDLVDKFSAQNVKIILKLA